MAALDLADHALEALGVVDLGVDATSTLSARPASATASSISAFRVSGGRNIRR